MHFCSDVSASRVQRLKGILGSYLPPEERAKITIKLANMTLISDNSTYNKVKKKIEFRFLNLAKFKFFFFRILRKLYEYELDYIIYMETMTTS